MLSIIIRKEEKSRWEARTPLTPKAISHLKKHLDIIAVEPSKKRIYSDDAYVEAGAYLSNELNKFQLILGIKEPPLSSIYANQVHLAFSHTIKGQTHNLPILKKFIEQKATLIDYEMIADDSEQRQIAFGRYAGIAGAIETLVIAGKKWQVAAEASGLLGIQPTIQYGKLSRLKKALSKISFSSHENLQVLIVGNGRVGRGAAEVCDWLGLKRVSLSEMLSKTLREPWYCMVTTEDVVQHKENQPFNKEEYRKWGKERYQSRFHEYLGYYNILIQTPFWNDTYPKLLPLTTLSQFKQKLPIVIGDISCDILGSLESTVKTTTIDEPCYTFDIDNHYVINGISWQGPTVMAIDNLPCALPQDASDHFSHKLEKYIREISNIDLSQSFEQLTLSDEIKKAVIVYKGEITEKYRYLNDFL